MPYYPTLQDYPTQTVTTEVFQGLNRNLRIADGQWQDMTNLTSDLLPMMASRNKRGIIRSVNKPLGMIGKAKLLWIDGSKVFYGDDDITQVLAQAGVVMDPTTEKQIVSMGAYAVVLPDKVYINTENLTDSGCIERQWDRTSTIQMRICKQTGEAYDITTTGDTAPQDPVNGALWLNTGSIPHSLMQYSTYTKEWNQVLTVFVRLESDGIGRQFAQFDAVDIAGLEGSSESFPELTGQIAMLNGSKIIQARDDNWIVVTGILDMAYTQEFGSVHIRRTMPDLDYVVESGNRLWGCKYGEVDGQQINEIYCCVLGDFKNWSRYMGISTDAYRASCGTDGPFTGAITYAGNPIFFKENCMHKVFPSSTGAHQINTLECEGVQPGCHDSLVSLEGRLFYKGRNGVMVYDGSVPADISQPLGRNDYTNASAGGYDGKYYLCMLDEADEWNLFVFDVGRGVWMREDDSQCRWFSNVGTSLYWVDLSTRLICCADSKQGAPEDDFLWSATTGIQGYGDVETKYIGRFTMRLKMQRNAKADMFIEYDSSGAWEHCGRINGGGLSSFIVPVRPRRCDHFRVKLEGIGGIRILSINKIYELGSETINGYPNRQAAFETGDDGAADGGHETLPF